MKTKYQLAIEEITRVVQDAMKDGHDKESAIDQAIEGVEDDVRMQLAKVTP